MPLFISVCDLIKIRSDFWRTNFETKRFINHFFLFVNLCSSPFLFPLYHVVSRAFFSTNNSNIPSILSKINNFPLSPTFSIKNPLTYASRWWHFLLMFLGAFLSRFRMCCYPWCIDFLSGIFVWWIIPMDEDRFVFSTYRLKPKSITTISRHQ